ncbi:MAG: DUF393 domain-containing protein [Candidatus Brocadiaceae bacterium]|nr:DUF393 domain-containing protein [Candidatus Brocadiaceae bacterium]
MKWVELHAIRKEVFEFLPCQSEERKRRYPEITEEACLRSLQLILPDNRILEDNELLPEILKRLRGFRWLYLLCKVSVTRQLLIVLYRWISRNRYIISRVIQPLSRE